MISLKNKKIDEYGRIIVESSQLFEFIYSDDLDIDRLFVEPSDEVTKFNELCDKFDIEGTKLKILKTIKESPEEYHKIRQSEWLFPKEYQNLDLKKYLMNKCFSQEQKDRIELEYQMFDERNMVHILKFLIYLVDIMRENKIVWGVGRGSSVASYSLYLIGIHKVDSIKYKLDISEFLR